MKEHARRVFSGVVSEAAGSSNLKTRCRCVSCSVPVTLYFNPLPVTQFHLFDTYSVTLTDINVSTSFLEQV
jgi:hypothetical protein